MTIKQLIKIEDNAQEIWVISPSLRYDTANREFSELVSVNLGEKTKYRYIVPATKEILENIEIYKKQYKLSESEVHNNFLLLPESDFTPFMLEIAIYDGNSDCIACAAPGSADGNEVIRFDDATARSMAQHFKNTWKIYMREKL
ncbi:MAG: hypothetical protein IPM42_07375 [Saprospiraceae bacterium]|nr:hypothetical protein [Saprospiraceae bacterium]